MFTGIVEEVGEVVNVRTAGMSFAIEIEGDIIFGDIKIGDSVSVNGVCLTVTNFANNIFRSDVMEATMMSSSIGDLKAGSLVNLERAMPANGRFGGHIVTGHIDGTGIISAIEPKSGSLLYSFTAAPPVMMYIVKKGSIAIDGISLTVADVWSSGFSVGIIPHTQTGTTLHTKKAGDKVNLETDIIGKYIERLLSFGQPNPPSNITEEFLAKHGFIGV
ncbi:MAG: riboflavin synthase [Defluviitaleaceae bacterium]|nr:riboflavin synthase [Defluviitaleaceae bacterium]